MGPKIGQKIGQKLASNGRGYWDSAIICAHTINYYNKSQTLPVT